MDKSLLQTYDAIPFPPHDSMGFSDMVRRFDGGFVSEREIRLVDGALLPEAALATLKRRIRLSSGGVPLTLERRDDFEAEEFELVIESDRIRLSASGDSGFRYGVCELEERWGNGESGVFHEKPVIRHRITRCFFAPNTRPPLKLDELDDDVDYYPEAYLDGMMHDRLNGVWLTIYLCDMPTRFFPERGEIGRRKLAKLKKVAEKCARYGIKCYLYMAEPRVFAGPQRWKSNTFEDLEKHPELGGHRNPDGTVQFCTSVPEFRQYMEDTLGYVFEQVPGLGGVINIMCQESAQPCGLWNLYPHSQACNCPRCSKLSAAEIFSSMASVFTEVIKSRQPDADFFGWFYAAYHMPGEPENQLRLDIAKAWPKNAYLLHNIETGGENIQLGKVRYVQDYSLSWPGPSDYFKAMAALAPNMAAKMQTGCSHEDATVPYLPVPAILYRRYKELLKTKCSGVMQCWYFGSAPSMMNRAAGRLSFQPFPETEQAFLEELARPVWGDQAPVISQAWTLFGDAYSAFPESITFKWFGPLHSSIIYPWHVLPADLPITPSWTQAFPKNSGDRLGECVGFAHTYAEIRTLLEHMAEVWSQGLELMAPCVRTEAQKAQYRIAEAIALQFRSTRRFFQFYHLRETGIWTRNMDGAAMKKLMDDEIADTLRMAQLCREDARLGYHSEVESYMFFPEKLEARARLLEAAKADLDGIDLESPLMRRYRGEGEPAFLALPEGQAQWFNLNGTDCLIASRPGRKLLFQFKNIAGSMLFELEPGRLSKLIYYPFDATYKHFNILKFQPGMSYSFQDGVLSLELDVDALKGFRYDADAPVRFNITCNGVSLAKRHPYPYRLLHGDSNPADLIWLRG